MVADIVSTRDARAQLRRGQIIDAARQCFGVSGFHGASMTQIATAASMSVGQIYRHFASKEAIIAAIVEQSVAERIEHIEAVEHAVLADGYDLVVASTRTKDPVTPTSDRDRVEAALMLEIIAEAARNPAVAEIVRSHDRQVSARAEQMVSAARPHWTPERVRNAVRLTAALFEGWRLRAIVDAEGFDAGAQQLRNDLLTFVMQE